MSKVRSDIAELADQINLIASVDPSHRIKTQGGQQIAVLVQAINKLADQYEKSIGKFQKQSPSDAQGLHEEENVLAAFISELPEGVLICNAEGQILLFNRKAREFLADGTECADQRIKHTGLGKSITTLIDKHLIEQALEEINERLNRKVLNAVSHFVIQAKGDHILRSQVMPILNRSGQFAGFIIILNDITQDQESDRRVASLLQALTKSARSPLASIRAAIEAMLEYPDMEKDRILQFNGIIHKESIILSNMLNAMAGDYSALISAKRSLVPVAGTDLLETIQKRARDRLGIIVHIEPLVEKIWLKVDSYSMLNAILFVLIRLKNQNDLWEFHCELRRDKKFATLDLIWPGPAISVDTVRRWEDQYLIIGEEKSPLVLKEVLAHHEAAIWPDAGTSPRDHAYIRFLLPAYESDEPKPVRPVTILPDSHADLYNPDLFGRPGSDTELDSRLLTELTYTVLIREIAEQEQVDEVVRKARELPGLIHRMMSSGAKVSNITRLITTVTDTVLRKLTQLALVESGPAPVPFAFLTLGSEGRKEQTLKTDQDNAIIFQDVTDQNPHTPTQVQHYFLGLGEKICAWLDQAGYAYCTGDVMAKNPRWCQPLSTWKTYFAQWIHKAQAEDLLRASIFFDLRCGYGDADLVENLNAYLFEALADWTGFFRYMAENAVYNKPPIGFFGNFIVETKGKHRNCLDIKRAIAPIVEFARIYALKNNIRETNTQERLYRLCLKKTLTPEEYKDIEQAYAFLMQIRFARQIKAVTVERSDPDNYINPRKLSSIEQKMLKEIFKKIERLQVKLSFEFTGLQDSQQE